MKGVKNTILVLEDDRDLLYTTVDILQHYFRNYVVIGVATMAEARAEGIERLAAIWADGELQGDRCEPFIEEILRECTVRKILPPVRIYAGGSQTQESHLFTGMARKPLQPASMGPLLEQYLEAA